MRLLLKKNKDKVKLSTNTISDKFSKKIVTLNIISLAETREVIAKK